MESFGRMIAVSLSTVGVVVLLLFHKSATVRWQKAETVHSMCQAYAADVLENKMVLETEWTMFCTQIKCLGGYRAELVVYERKRYEGEEGRVYLFTEGQPIGETMISEGSYVRLLVTEEYKSKAEAFIYGESCFIIAGGRVS